MTRSGEVEAWRGVDRPEILNCAEPGLRRADFRQVTHCNELFAFVEDIELGFVDHINTCICESKSRIGRNNSP